MTIPADSILILTFLKQSWRLNKSWLALYLKSSFVSNHDLSVVQKVHTYSTGVLVLYAEVLAWIHNKQGCTDMHNKYTTEIIMKT
jgi:hypothetical protein